MENFLLKTNEIDNLKALVSVNGLDQFINLHLILQ